MGTINDFIAARSRNTKDDRLRGSVKTKSTIVAKKRRSKNVKKKPRVKTPSPKKPAADKT